MMKRPLSHWLAVGALAVSLGFPAHKTHAQILSQYTFANYTTNTGDSPATTVAANLTATDYLANGTAFTTFQGGGSASNYAFNTGGNDGGTDKAIGTQSTDIPSTEALSVSDNTYFSFTLTPTAGDTLNLSSFTFFLRIRINAGGTAPYTGNVAVRTSLDSFATDVGTATGTETTVTDNTGYVAQSFSLTGLGSAGTLTAGTPVTFRLYLFDNQNVSQDDLTIDTVTVNGTVLVPEPSTWALLGLGAASLLFIRLRRRAV